MKTMMNTEVAMYHEKPKNRDAPIRRKYRLINNRNESRSLVARFFIIFLSNHHLGLLFAR